MKEEESFSNALTIVTSAIYVVILAAAFAGLMVTRTTTGEAVYTWVKDFGSIIAGLPVIVAVVVAKQQLDASRIQHEAAIKLQFKDELEGLQMAAEVASSLRTPKVLRSFLFTSRKKITDSEVESVAKSGSPEVIKAFADLKAVVNDGAKLARPKNLATFMTGDSGPFDDDETVAAKAVLSAVGNRKKFLRQFLPSLV